MKKILIMLIGLLGVSYVQSAEIKFLNTYDQLANVIGQEGHWFVRDAAGTSTGQHGDPTVIKGWAMYTWDTLKASGRAGWVKICEEESMDSSAAESLVRNYVTKTEFNDAITNIKTNYTLLTKHSADLAALQTIVTALDVRTSTVESDMGAVQEDVTSINRRVTNLSNELILHEEWAKVTSNNVLTAAKAYTDSKVGTVTKEYVDTSIATASNNVVTIAATNSKAYTDSRITQIWTEEGSRLAKLKETLDATIIATNKAALTEAKSYADTTADAKDLILSNNLVRISKDYTDVASNNVLQAAASDATDKASAAKSGAEATAKSYTDTEISTLKSYVDAQDSAVSNNVYNMAKAYTDAKDPGSKSYVEAQIAAVSNNVIAIAASDATTKSDTAESNAKTYADGLYVSATNHTETLVKSTKTDLTNDIAIAKSEAITAAKTYADAQDTVVSNAAVTAINGLDTRVEAVEKKISTVYHFKGSCTFAELPTTGNTEGDVWYVTDKKESYAWSAEKESWYSLGGGVDLSIFKSWSDTKIYIDTADSNITIKVNNKQDKLPYETNAIPAAVIDGQSGLTIGSRKSGTSVGTYSVAEGKDVTASSDYSHAEGQFTIATNLYSHAEGRSTTSFGHASHAEGYNTKTVGYASHSEGLSSTASNHYSHAEGESTIAAGLSSHSEGWSTTSAGPCSHSEGYQTSASGDVSHSEGRLASASGFGSHAEGYSTTASGMYSHAEGYNTYSESIASKSSGILAHATNDYAFVWNGWNSFGHYGSHGEGTFSINPVGGLSGFWIGDINLESSILNISNNVLSISKAYTDSKISGGSMDTNVVLDIIQTQKSNYATNIADSARSYTDLTIGRKKFQLSTTNNFNVTEWRGIMVWREYEKEDETSEPVLTYCDTNEVKFVWKGNWYQDKWNEETSEYDQIPVTNVWTTLVNDGGWSDWCYCVSGKCDTVTGKYTFWYDYDLEDGRLISWEGWHFKHTEKFEYNDGLNVNYCDFDIEAVIPDETVDDYLAVRSELTTKRDINDYVVPAYTFEPDDSINFGCTNFVGYYPRYSASAAAMLYDDIQAIWRPSYSYWDDDAGELVYVNNVWELVIKRDGETEWNSASTYMSITKNSTNAYDVSCVNYADKSNLYWTVSNLTDIKLPIQVEVPVDYEPVTDIRILRATSTKWITEYIRLKPDMGDYDEDRLVFASELDAKRDFDDLVITQVPNLTTVLPFNISNWTGSAVSEAMDLSLRAVWSASNSRWNIELSENGLTWESLGNTYITGSYSDEKYTFEVTWSNTKVATFEGLSVITNVSLTGISNNSVLTLTAQPEILVTDRIAKTSDLENYVTTNQLTTTLTNYATKADIQGLGGSVVTNAYRAEKRWTETSKIVLPNRETATIRELWDVINQLIEISKTQPVVPAE